MVDAPADADAARYRTLVDKVWNDPELGSAVRKLAKATFPDLRIPEDNMAPILAPLKAENAALSKKLDDLLAAQAERDKKAEEREKAGKDEDFMRGLKKARETFNLTDEGFDKMTARMKETGNYTDPMAAAAYIVSQEPPPQAPGPAFGYGDLDFVGSSQVNEKYKLLHQNPEKYFDSEVRDMLKDPRGYVAKEMGDQYATMAFGR